MTCYRCGYTHPTDGTSCSDARSERHHAQAEFALSIVADANADQCRHHVPIALCVECKAERKLVESRRAEDTESEDATK